MSETKNYDENNREQTKFEVSPNYKGKNPKSPEELAKIRSERVPQNVQRHKKLCKELNDIYAKKNKAYGNSFSDSYQQFGIISAVTRMSDKWNRLVNLAKHPERNDIKDESLVDTCKDLANYALMLVMELEGEKK